MTRATNDAPGTGMGHPQTQTAVLSGTASMPVKRQLSRRFAVAAATIGGSGAVGFLILFLVFITAMSSVDNGMRGSSNPLQAVSTGFGVGYFIVFYIMPFAFLICCANFIGILLSAVALCRSNGRGLGFCGLLLNIIPAALLVICVALVCANH